MSANTQRLKDPCAHTGLGSTRAQYVVWISGPCRLKQRTAPRWCRPLRLVGLLQPRVSVGFAFTSTSVINDDVLAASVVTAKHSRWCGQDIEAGDVLIHGPQALHTASNPEGFAVTFAVVPTQDVGVASSSLGSAHRPLDREVCPAASDTGNSPTRPDRCWSIQGYPKESPLRATPSCFHARCRCRRNRRLLPPS